MPAGAIARIHLRIPAKSLAVGQAADDKRLRVGEARDVALERDDIPASPQWIALASGAHVARVALVSPGAASLRLALRARGLPIDAELRFVSPQDPQRVVGPVTGAAIEEAARVSGRYWTPLTEGEEQQVEVWLPPGAATSGASVDVVAASHIHVSASHLMKSTGVGASQSCEQDVACTAATNPALDRAARSVAKLLYTDNGVSYLCTGTLVSDGDARSDVPYLYTAAHCIDSQAAAATLNTFWFFRAASCGSKSTASYQQLAGGATLLYANDATDAALLRLADAAPDGAWLSGWSGAPLDGGAALVALHHPAGDVEKLSLGQALGATAGFDAVAWTSGSTEGGSSGSGIFTLEGGEYVLRGGLRGGSASCTSSGHVDDPSNRDLYSRLADVAPSLGKWLASAPQPIASYQGVWFQPAEPGWGVTLLQQGDHVFVTWYVYDADGRPSWLVMPAAQWTGAAALQGTLYRASGTPLGADYDPSRFAVAPVGTLALEFQPDGSARLTATVDGVEIAKTLVRQAF
jgi:hypothetical protein